MNTDIATRDTLKFKPLHSKPNNGGDVKLSVDAYFKSNTLIKL